VSALISGRGLRRIIIGIAIVAVGIQFVPVDRSNPPVTSEVPASPEVRAVLRRACYDCHSNETVWPSYTKVAPMSWLAVRDVQKGRRELNFSEWNQYTASRQAKLLKESWKEVAEGEMPLWFYLPTHRDAILSAGDRALLRAWSQAGSPG
jgi:hypothetical protein